MNVNIRPFVEEDYAALVELINAAHPENPLTETELRFWYTHRDPKTKFQQHVTEHDGRLVGAASYDQPSYMFHPLKFHLRVTVHPEYESQDTRLRSALYDYLMDALQPFEPISVTAGAREDRTHQVRFWQEHGFQETMRAWQSRLDVNTFDLSAYAGVGEKVRVHGIEIKTLRELESDADRNHKLYELEYLLDQDVPAPEPITKISFELFMQYCFENPNLLLDAYFVAVDGDDYVGISALWANQGSHDLSTGLTGVKREYRRKSIALAMKLRGIAYAKEHGHPSIDTWNESKNRGMLAINARLGFVREPASIDYVKVLREEPQSVAEAPTKVTV